MLEQVVQTGMLRKLKPGLIVATTRWTSFSTTAPRYLT